jgi:hypothetical protein
MKLYRLHRTQTLPVSLEEAWQFFSFPLHRENLHNRVKG